MAALALVPLAVACAGGPASHAAPGPGSASHAAPGPGSGAAARPATDTGPPLRGTVWRVTALGTGGRAPAPLPVGTDAHLRLDPGADRMTGRLGCNRFTARATVSDGHITLGAAATTRMMCDASLMDVERRLLRLFDGGSATYRVEQGTLALTSANGVTVIGVQAS